MKPAYRTYALIFAVALLFRTLVFAVSPLPPVNQGDAPDYLAIARSMQDQGGYSLDGEKPTAFRSPLYPVFLSFLPAAGNAADRAVYFLQMIVDSLTCVLLYALARKWLNRPLAQGCALFGALYYPMAFRGLFVMTETFFTFFLTASLLVLAQSPNRSERSFWSGILLGLAALTRANGVIVFLFVLPWFWIFNRQPVRRATLFAAGFALVLAPWVVRNYLTFEKPILTNTVGGITLYNSYILADDGLGYNQIRPEHQHVYESGNEAAISSALTRITVEHILADPAGALRLLPVKMGLLVYPYDIRWLDPNLPFKFNPWWGILGTLGFFGFLGLLANREAKAFSLLLMPLLALLCTSVVFYGSPRLRAPFDPLIMILGARGVAWIWQSRGRYFWVSAVAALQALMFFAGRSPDLIRALVRLKPW